MDGRILESRGSSVCRWIEDNLVFGEGDLRGERVRLEGFQRRFLYRLYEFWPDGTRRYKKALFGMGKGNGKSPLAAWVGAAELLGPTAPASPHILIGAASLRQANYVFGDLKAAVARPSPLARRVQAQDLQVLLRGAPGVAERVAAEAGTNDGARATALLVDELHEWKGAWERGFTVLDGALAKRRNAFSLSISTAGAGRSGVLYDLYDLGKRIASGELRDDSFLFEWYEAPPDLDLDDPEQRLQAILAANPAAGLFNPTENIEYRFQSIPRFEWERYHANRFTAPGRDPFLAPGTWASTEHPRDIPPRSHVTLGFSGNYTGSQAALIGAFDGHIFTLDAWESPDGARVSPAEVDGAVRRAMATYRVDRLACNPPGWEADVERWVESFGDRAVVSFEVRKRLRFADACARFRTAVVTGSLSHDPHVVLTRHLEEAAVKETAEGAYITGDVAAAKAAVIAWDQASATKKAPGRLVTF